LTNQGGGVWRLQASAGSWLLYQSRPSTGTHNFSIEVKSNGAGLDGFSLMLGSSAGGADRAATGDWVRYSASGLSGDIGIIRNSALAAVDVLIRFFQFELGSTATAYQRVTTQYDVTEAGVPSCSYLFFDGADDFMLTGTITPGTDKAQVFAGVRKLSDAALGMLVESSANAGGGNAFQVRAPGSASNNYMFGSGGTLTNIIIGTGYTAPITNTLTATGDISGDIATLRVNGTQVGQDTTDQGTGNYAAHPIYLGRRAGTSLPFSGNLFGLITRFGPNLASTNINATEYWLNEKTGAY
jgi:hypothetical protein